VRSIPVDVLGGVQHDASVIAGHETRPGARRALSLGVAGALGALCLSCARPPASVAPPVAPAATSAPADAPRPAAAPNPPVPVASLAAAAGRPLWSRDGLPADRAVTAGDAVVAVEGSPATPSPAAPATPATPSPAAPAGSSPPGVAAAPAAGAAARPPYLLVVLDAASGRVRVTHRLGGAAGPPPGQPAQKSYRGAPVATVPIAAPSAAGATNEEAYNAAGRRVWKSPSGGLALFGDEGEYTTTGYAPPPAGSPPVPVHELKSLTGAGITAFGPVNGEQVRFVHGGAAVVTRGRVFRVATVARRPRTLWSSSQAVPHGFTGATPVAVLGDRLLVQWDNAASRLLALYDLTGGRQVWRGESLRGQATPGAVAADADSHVAVIGSDGTGPALGIDVRTGKIVWRSADRQSIRPVAAAHGRVYGASGDTALVIDARTGRITTLGSHVEFVGLTGAGILVLRGAVGPATGRIWALRPAAAGP
jgi:hypothetical protein